MNKEREALPVGTKIEYCGMLATVVEDHGGDTLIVDCEGDKVKWRWAFDGETCKVVSNN